MEEDVNEALFLDLRPKIEERHLSPELKHLEEQMESELLDVLSESWDDSTILRRDTLLAELYFRLDQMVIRFLDSGVSNEVRKMEFFVEAFVTKLKHCLVFAYCL